MKRCALFVLTALLVLPAFGQEDGPPLNVYHGEIPAGDRTFYVATDGDNANPGTEELPWATVDYAVDQVELGDVIVVRGGVYEHDDTVRIEGSSGFVDQLIVLTAYPGEVPILDFSKQPKERNEHGVRLNANWWHIIGITIRNASHNGIRMDGSYNILEQLTAYGNHDTGIHMAGGASNNVIKNCDSFHNFNYDTVRSQDDEIGGNADGFSAKFEIGPGNRFVGCRAWENSDDGWDFWEAGNTIVIDSSWAFGNGDESVFGDFDNYRGNGNGFKLGGGSPAPEVGHVVRRSLAFDNFGSSGNAKGFDYNNNRGAMTLIHNTAYNNGRNFYFPLWPSDGQAVFLNNLSAVVDEDPVTPPQDALLAGNSWQHDTEVTADMFMSVNRELAKAPREQDGSLPENDFLRPAPGTFIIGGGVPLTEPFYGTAPDIGAFELVDGEPTQPWVDRGAGEFVADLDVYDLEHAENWTLRSELEIGDHAYGDTDATISSLDNLVVVEEWIQTAAASRTKNYLFPAAELSLTELMTVFVAHADAIAAKPEWLSEYSETEYDLVVSEGGEEHVMSLYGLEVGPNEIVRLGRNSQDGRDSAPMYIVIVGWIFPVSAEDDAQPASESQLHEIYPNPVGNTATISFSLAHTANVSITIYDSMGREVAKLARGLQEAGEHTLRWDVGRLANGVYYCKMTADGQTTVRKLLRIR